jgi:hypothetical protein
MLDVDYSTPAAQHHGWLSADHPRLEILSRRLPLLLALAIAVGTATDLLLVNHRPGLNLLVIALAACTAIVALVHRQGLSRPRIMLLSAALVFAAGASLRDTPALLALNLLGCMLCFAMAAWTRPGASFATSAVMQPVLSALQFWANSLGGAAAFLSRELGWDRLAVWLMGPHARTIVGGVVISLPLLLVFGALFCAADEQFASWMNQAVSWLPFLSIDHVLRCAILSWLSVGALRQFAYVAPAV